MKSWKNLIIDPSATVKQALKVINETSEAQIALVVNKDLQLIGTVSDGDIRRGLLKDLSLSSPVTHVMNVNPKTVLGNATTKQIQDLQREHHIRQIPVLDENNTLIDLIVSPHFTEVKAKSNTVVLLVGGKGERLGELTKNFPKPLLDVGGKPLLETTIDNFKKQGFNNFLLSINFKSDIIKDFLGNGSSFGVNIDYLQESEALGTAGCLKLIEKEINAPMIIMNGDILTNTNFEQMLNFHHDMGSIATMCVKEYVQDIPYGVVSSEGNILQSLSEKPKFSYFINAGMYILSPSALDFLPSKVSYFDMTSLFMNIKEKHNNVFTYPLNDYWLDIGRLSDLERARYEYSKYF